LGFYCKEGKLDEKNPAMFLLKFIIELKISRLRREIALEIKETKEHNSRI
jgi:hypothetical protein